MMLRCAPEAALKPINNKKGLLTPAKRAIAAPPCEWEYNSGSGQSDVFFIPLSYSAPPLPMLPLEFQGAVQRQETRVMGLRLRDPILNGL